jgi:nucleoside-diphosphate-sugar epimerase
LDSILLSGATGFVGTNLAKFFSDEYTIFSYRNYSPLFINQTSVIHLAGKSHDLKITSNPEVYYQVNTELTKKVFNAFLASNAKVFITLSSVKAVADEVQGELIEEHIANPITHYGKSKLLAEQYILSKKIPEGKRVYILRPCMIHGPGNKGNLNLLFQ